MDARCASMFVIYLMAIPALQKEFSFGLDTAGLLVTVALLDLRGSAASSSARWPTASAAPGH